MEYLKGYGYEVRVLNVVDPNNSHRYDGLEGARENPLFITNIVEAIISNTGGGVGDPIYDAAEGNLLTALIFLQFEREDVEYPTLKGAYQVLLDTGDAEELDQYFSALLPPSRALAAYNLFKKASDNMKGNICLGLGTRLSVLQNEEIADLMCGGDMDLQLLGKKKMAYFLILSDQDNTTRFVAATFFSLLFLRLVQYAGQHESCRERPPATASCRQHLHRPHQQPLRKGLLRPRRGHPGGGALPDPLQPLDGADGAGRLCEVLCPRYL